MLIPILWSAFITVPEVNKKNLLLIVIASRIVSDNGALTTCSVGTFKHTASLTQPKAKLYAREQGMQAMPYERGPVSWKAALLRSLWWTSNCTPASSAMPRSSGTEARVLARTRKEQEERKVASANRLGAPDT